MTEKEEIELRGTITALEMFVRGVVRTGTHPKIRGRAAFGSNEMRLTGEELRKKFRAKYYSMARAIP